MIRSQAFFRWFQKKADAHSQWLLTAKRSDMQSLDGWLIEQLYEAERRIRRYERNSRREKC